MRRALNETALSVAALGVLMLALVSSDSRVREQIALHVSSGPTAAVATVGKQLEDFTILLLQAARDQSVAHAPLVILVIAAIALLAFMLRM
jgi:hypothetical protein